MSDPIKSYARKLLRERFRRLGLACQHPRCLMPGVPIDYTPVRRGDPIPPNAYVLDEIRPRVDGGDPLDPENCRPSHWRCNAAAGARIGNARRRAVGGRPSGPTLVLDDW